MRDRYGLTLARLREELGVSRVTLWRDLRAPGDAGVPVEEQSAGGEKRIVLRTSDLPALILSPLQVQALDLSLRVGRCRRRAVPPTHPARTWPAFGARSRRAYGAACDSV
jgi:predicted DNA-binding transcriptional regulator YafY